MIISFMVQIWFRSASVQGLCGVPGRKPGATHHAGNRYRRLPETEAYRRQAGELPNLDQWKRFGPDRQVPKSKGDDSTVRVKSNIMSVDEDALEHIMLLYPFMPVI